MPSQATSSSFLINDTPQIPQEDGSYKITIPAGRTITATYQFSLPRSLTQNNFVYSYAEQKQAGITGQTLNVQFKNNLSYSPKVIAPSALLQNKEVFFYPSAQAKFLGAIAF